jgi:error-prone DNA polymerase
MSTYVELRAKSFYSFGEGASHVHELLTRAADLSYPAFALTDTNLCGAHEFAKQASQMGVKPITGGQITLTDGSRITLLARSRQGYAHLSRLFTLANFQDRQDPRLDPVHLPEHSEGLTLITGCSDSTISRLLQEEDHSDQAANLLGQYVEWFGQEHVYLGLQQNRMYGDTTRNHRLVRLARRCSVPLVATNDVHYHLPERHKLQNVLTAIRKNRTLDEVIHDLKLSPEFYLKSSAHIERLFSECPEALRNTIHVAEACQFNLASDLGYRLPVPSVPEGYTTETYLQRLSQEAAMRRYGRLPGRVKQRLEEEFRLIHKHGLAGFLLLYREIALIAHEVMVEGGRRPPETPIELWPPWRSRGSSVALLVGYLIGISHVDPLAYHLTLERFLPEDMKTLPDIDLDFPRDLRHKLIERIHQRFGPEYAVIAGAIATYQMRGIISDVGKAIGLPGDGLRRLADNLDSHDPAMLRQEMLRLTDLQDKVDSPGWRELIEIAPQLGGAPKGLGQHVGGLILSSSPITEMVPVREGAIAGRYIMDWDKDTVADAGFAKIDLLSLPVLDQIDNALDMVEQRTGHRPDLSQIDVDAPSVYDMINQGRTIGVFLLQSPAQLKMCQRLKSRNITDLAYQVALIRPGVGVQGSAVNSFVERYRHGAPWEYDHPLEGRALGRSCGIIIWQEQVVQVLADVGAMTTAEADEIRRAFAKPNKGHLLPKYRERFLAGATGQGVPQAVAERIWGKINGHYMFPESHSYAFGINALQAAWVKAHYPVEFFAALFNHQPMGFYPLEVLKQDGRRFGVPFLNPDINRSAVDCCPVGGNVLMGLRFVKDVGSALATAIIQERQGRGPFGSVGDFVQRTGLKPQALQSMTLAGAFECLTPNRRAALWEAGLYHGSRRGQLALPFVFDQDVPDLEDFSEYQKALGEYAVLGIYPKGHLMQFLRSHLKGVLTTSQVESAREGQHVTVAGWVVARQHPRGEDGTIFVTVEDEHFYCQLILWRDVYQKSREALRNHVIKATGKVSRWDGTANVIVSQIEAVEVPAALPRAHDWR